MLLAAGIAVPLGGCGGGEIADEPRPRPIAVRVVSPSVEPLRHEAHYVGELGSALEATVLARTAGTIEDFPRSEGERVRRGEVLAILAAPEQTARQRRAASELARAREESELACKQHATNERLHRSGALPRVQLDRSASRCAASGAAVDAARSGLQELHAVGDKREERAPFDGRILAWRPSPARTSCRGVPSSGWGATRARCESVSSRRISDAGSASVRPCVW